MSFPQAMADQTRPLETVDPEATGALMAGLVAEAVGAAGASEAVEEMGGLIGGAVEDPEDLEA